VLATKTFMIRGGHTTRIRARLTPGRLAAARRARRLGVFVFSRDATGQASITQATLQLLAAR
jgi:hypothetical protein